ncbi:MAG: hypothetical protein ACYSWZ_11175 [Planctomycetota bacterium]
MDVERAALYVEGPFHEAAPAYAQRQVSELGILGRDVLRAGRKLLCRYRDLVGDGSDCREDHQYQDCR